MKNNIRFFSIVLLFFCSVSALYGGGALVADPTGGLLQMPVSYLAHSPFKDFLIPGIILLVLVGFSCIDVAIITIRRSSIFPLALIYQGVVLIIWIVVELIMVRSYMFLQVVYFVSGVLLVAIGVYLKKPKTA
jgi:hypothetical protein